MTQSPPLSRLLRLLRRQPALPVALSIREHSTTATTTQQRDKRSNVAHLKVISFHTRALDYYLQTKRTIFEVAPREDYRRCSARNELSSSMSPLPQVFRTAELLEAILLQLPLRDALLVQQLCTAWRDTITTSVSLRRALFLRPAQKPTNTKSSIADQIHHMTLSTSCNDSIEEPGSTTILTSILPISKSSTGTSYKLTGHDLPECRDDQTVSWQKMLISQPSRSAEQFFFNSTSDSTCDRSSSFLHSEKEQTLSATIYYGKQFGLDAMQLVQPGGVTLETFVIASASAKERFEGAKMKGRELQFGWVRGGGHARTMEAVVELWMDIKLVQVEKLIALQQIEVDDEEEYESGEEGEQMLNA